MVAQIGQAPSAGHQRHIVPRLQQVTGIDAPDHAGAEH
jgi:CO dehydrogenase/acetyl-CoA synthase alpha subunit